MKTLFKGYIPYEEKEKEQIWKKSLVVLDTNVILNFYRYSKETRNEIWKILGDLEERLWIPYQVGYEYFKNKEMVIAEVETSLPNAKKDVEKYLEKARKILDGMAKKDIQCKQKIEEKISRTEEEVIELMEEEQKQQEQFSQKDIVFEKVIEWLNGRCGEEAEEKTLQEIKKEAKRREENKIPPGYCDRKKEENFGDYYIFYDMIEKAKREKKDVIFITDDEKEDWYWIKNGQKCGGRPELLNEFFKKTHQRLYICNTKTFVKRYQQQYKENDISDKVIEEIADVSKREETQEVLKFYGKARMRPYASDKKLIEHIRYMKFVLRNVLLGEESWRWALRKIEKVSNCILKERRYERYHGKILMLVDELEKQAGAQEAIMKAMRKLDVMIMEIQR